MFYVMYVYRKFIISSIDFRLLFNIFESGPSEVRPVTSHRYLLLHIRIVEKAVVNLKLVTKNVEEIPILYIYRFGNHFFLKNILFDKF